MSKLGPITDNWWNEDFGWVGHPACEQKGEDETLLIERRADVELVGGIEDEDLNYEYDEFALVKLDGVYYLLQTSGCSCPSPSETWSVQQKGTLQEIRDSITSGEYKGYTLPAKKNTEFLALIDAEAGT